MAKALFDIEENYQDKEVDKPIELTPVSKEEELVNKANTALGGMGEAGNGQKEATEEEMEMLEISDEDTRLASELIIRGYAEKVVELKDLGARFTICSSTSEEVDTINDIIFNFLQENTDEKGEVNISERLVVSLRNSLSLTFGYVGINGTDISSNPISKLATIKSGVKKLAELTAFGEVDRAASIKKDLYKAINDRARMIRELPTAVIDFLTDAKYKFDGRMYDILRIKGIIPKS